MNRSRCFAAAVVLIAIALALACGGRNKATITDVYVAGQTFTAANTSVATYWKNGTPVNLTDGSHWAVAYSIFVSGSDVYVAGIEAGDTNHWIAKYWKNGAAVALTDGTQDAFAQSIFLAGSDVYVAGNDWDVPVYWKNGARIPLTDGTQPAQVWSIIVSGTDVYVAGYEYKTTPVANTYLHAAAAKYWKNGVPVELSDGLQQADARSIFLSGNDVYAAGFEYSASGAVAKYWKNGVPVALQSSFSDANSIFVSATHIYVAGKSSRAVDVAELWTDGVRTSLTNGARQSSATQVVASGDDVYVTGQDGIAAGYWKNGVPVVLTDRGSANSIAVVTRQD